MKNMVHGIMNKIFGYNYRLNDLQAALGINQIKRLNPLL